MALVIGRRPGQSILIGDELRLTLLPNRRFAIDGRTVHVGATFSRDDIEIESIPWDSTLVRFRITAPREIKILREELLAEDPKTRAERGY